MLAADRAATETLPLSLTLVAIVSVLAMVLDDPERRLESEEPPVSLDGRTGAPSRHPDPSGQPAGDEEAGLRGQTTALLLLRLQADPALAARTGGSVDPAAALAPSDLGRLAGGSCADEAPRSVGP